MVIERSLYGVPVELTAGDLLDATVLVLDWYSGPDQTRGATAGASDDRASH